MAGRADDLTALTLASDGAQLFAGAGRAMLPVLERWFDAAPAAPGTRIAALGPLAPFLTGDSAIGSIVADMLGPDARPVRAIAFDKSRDANWALGWHQDRTISLARKAELEGFGPWTVKQGQWHVEPPFAVIAAMLTLRIHLDPVTHDNAPLAIACGSHARGAVPEPRIAAEVARSRTAACLAQPGDVWAYATAILHASPRSTATGRRRVLQVDYAPPGLLPTPLAWALDCAEEALPR